MSTIILVEVFLKLAHGHGAFPRSAAKCRSQIRHDKSHTCITRLLHACHSHKYSTCFQRRCRPKIVIFPQDFSLVKSRFSISSTMTCYDIASFGVIDHMIIWQRPKLTISWFIKEKPPKTKDDAIEYEFWLTTIFVSLVWHAMHFSGAHVLNLMDFGGLLTCANDVFFYITTAHSGD